MEDGPIPRDRRRPKEKTSDKINKRDVEINGKTLQQSIDLCG